MTTRWNTTVPCVREGCEGLVHVQGYYDPGSREVAPEGESHVDACDTCGCAEWSDAEEDALTIAAQCAGDGYDGPDTLEEMA